MVWPNLGSNTAKEQNRLLLTELQMVENLQIRSELKQYLRHSALAVNTTLPHLLLSVVACNRSISLASNSYTTYYY